MIRYKSLEIEFLKNSHRHLLYSKPKILVYSIHDQEQIPSQSSSVLYRHADVATHSN